MKIKTKAYLVLKILKKLMSGLKSKIGNIQFTAKFWIIFIITLIILLIFYYALLDRYTPYTDDAVLTFVDDKSWWVVANFRENSVGRIRTGQSAEISIAMYPGKIFKAVVENADWRVSSGQGIPSGDLPEVENPENWFKLSQSFPVRLKITNLDEEKFPLRVGGTASVAVFTGGGLILNNLARLWLRIGSVVDYVY